MKRLFRTRAPSLVAGFALALGFALTPSAAHADIIFELGNNPPLGETVQFPTTNVPGDTVTGETNQTHTPVTFISLQGIVAPSGGQARVEATSGDLNQLFIGLFSHHFNHLIINPFDGSGTATVTALDDGGQLSMFDYALGNGENFLTISTINGQQIAFVEISAPGGFQDLRQVRVGGIRVAVVPEPASMALLAGGGLPLLGMLRRRRRRDEEDSA
jgi:hypothetical protein